MVGAQTANNNNNDTTTMSSTTTTIFNPEHCLFCYHQSPSFESCLSHMRSTHGFTIPYQNKLLVDVETLLAYLHLVIFGYRQCLWCGVVEERVSRVQRHMREECVCGFEVEGEFGEFYDDSGEEEVEEMEDEEGRVDDEGVKIVKVDDETARLPSGRVVMVRGARPVYDPRRRDRSSPEVTTGLNTNDHETSQSDSTSADINSAHSQPHQHTTHLSSHIPPRQDRTTSTAITQLRATDQQALSHLPRSQQYAIIMSQRRQVDKARKAGWKSERRVEYVEGKRVVVRASTGLPTVVVGSR